MDERHVEQWLLRSSGQPGPVERHAGRFAGWSEQTESGQPPCADRDDRGGPCDAPVAPRQRGSVAAGRVRGAEQRGARCIAVRCAALAQCYCARGETVAVSARVGHRRGAGVGRHGQQVARAEPRCQPDADPWASQHRARPARICLFHDKPACQMTSRLVDSRSRPI